MGIAAIAGIASIAGTAIAAGTSIYGAVSAGDNTPQGQAAAYNKQLKQLANQYLSPYMNANYWNMNNMIPSYVGQSTSLTGQINQAAYGQLTGLLNQALPGYQGMMNQAGANTAALLQGQIPADVQNQIQRSTAFQALRGGFAGTGAAGALTARDLGLTSLQLQGQGQQQMGNLLQLARSYTMPQMLNPASLLSMFNANDQWSRTQQYNATMNYVNMRTQGAAAIASAPYQSNIGAIGSGIAGLTGALGATNPQTGQSALGNALYGIGQWTGSNYNPYFNQAWADQQAQAAGYSDYASMVAAGAV